MFYSFKITGKFRPLQDWVILRPIKEKAKDRGGIELPDNLAVYGRCEVMAVGPGRRPYRDGIYGPNILPTELKPGQFVFIQKFVEGEMKFNLNGQDVYALRERTLNLTIEDDPEEVVIAQEEKPKGRRKRAA